jgi:proteasome activator subunit 4
LQPIVDRFKNDATFFPTFIRLACIEESKGNEKFDKKKFMLFKSLFRNFGSTRIVANLFDHLTKLVNDKQQQTAECSHKLAAEIVSGLIRGSKYWPLADLKDLWVKLRVLFDQVFETINTENLGLWFQCFSNSFEDQDPRRMTFYLNYFVDLTLRMFNESGEQVNKPTSFQQTSCLHLLISLGQMEWRIQTFWSLLLDTFMRQMSHSYKSIREKVI